MRTIPTLLVLALGLTLATPSALAAKPGGSGGATVVDRSAASRKGWVTRRANEAKQGPAKPGAARKPVRQPSAFSERALARRYPYPAPRSSDLPSVSETNRGEVGESGYAHRSMDVGGGRSSGLFSISHRSDGSVELTGPENSRGATYRSGTTLHSTGEFWGMTWRINYDLKARKYTFGTSGQIRWNGYNAHWKGAEQAVAERNGFRSYAEYDAYQLRIRGF